MRLTLRTLLAYLDGILEPNDSQDLNKKIEESEYATSLIHRIRDVMRRLRLGAPNLTDRGPGLDPNTVAEYLDNTLAGDRVTDFEKVCLDSDVHLAEVASCHQILTLVLGEPAAVDAASRERVYNLKDSQVAAASSHVPPAIPPIPAMPTGAAPVLDLNDDGDPAKRRARPRPTVPEYLREPRKRPAWLPVAAGVVLAVCLAFVVLMVLGQFEPGTPLGDWVRGPRANSRQVAEKGAEKGIKNEGPAAKNEGQEERQQEKEENSQKSTAPEGTANPPTAETNEKPGKEPPAGRPSKNPPSESIKRPEGEKTRTPTTVVPPGTETPANTESPAKTESPANTEITAAPPKPKTEKPPVGAIKEPEAPAVRGTKPSSKSTAPPDAEPPPVPDNKAGKATEARPGSELPPLPPEPLGRLLSSDQVLLIAEAAGDWTRVAPDQALISQQLLALPTYRDKVALTAGVTLEILGPARIELLGNNNRQGLPGIHVFYGRVVLTPQGKAGARLQVAFGDHSGVLAFDDSGSVAAFDVRRIRAPGTNPESGPSRIVADLYVTNAGILWEETTPGMSVQPLQLAPLQRVNFDTQLTSAPKAVKELPKWIAAEPIKQSDRWASPAIARALSSDRPARVGLLEVATSRLQKDVKWLALRCLGCVGQFHDMVTALNEPAHKLEWSDYYIDELRAAVDRDAETAAAVRLALEQQYPQQAATLYRMLWGYSNQDLKAGEDAKLVQGLKDEETLAVRVLAFWNLKDITGLGHLYQPEQTAAKRQMATRRWEQRLEAKEIRLKNSEEKAGPAARERTRLPGPGPAQ